MSSDSALPTACERCTSLLLRGTTACRVCGWDSAAGSAPPAAQTTTAAPYATAPVGYGAPAGGQQVGGPGAQFGQATVPVGGGYPPGYGLRGYPAPLSLARAAVVLVALTCASAVAMDLLLYATTRQARATLTSAFNDDGGFESAAATTTGLAGATGLMALVYFALLLAAGVVTIVWTVKAREHAVARRTHPQQYSSGWVVAGWLVPFVSLVVPIRAVADIWHANDPRRTTGAGIPGVLWAWWLTYLGGGLIAAWSYRSGDSDALTVPLSVWLGTAALCGGGALFIHILRQISAWQQVAPVAPPHAVTAV